MYPQRKGGLTFLFKKQFNPANIANQAEVYDAEQRYEREMKMLEQRKKDLAEQEEISRLRREQALATGKPIQERLEWMYEDPLASSRMPLSSSAVETAAHQEQLESYLLGKEYVDPRGSEIKQVQNAIGASFVETACDPERDALRKIQEDPMLLIRKSEQASLRAVLENPVKMRLLSEQKMKECLEEWGKYSRKYRHREKEKAVEAMAAAKKKLAKVEDRIAHLLEADKTGKARETLQEANPALAEVMKKRVPPPPPPPPSAGKIIADARRQQKLLASGKLKRPREDEGDQRKEDERDRNRDSKYGLHVPEGPLPKRMKEVDEYDDRDDSGNSSSDSDHHSHRHRDKDDDRHHHHCRSHSRDRHHSHRHSHHDRDRDYDRDRDHHRHRSHRSRSRSSSSEKEEKRYDARKHRKEVQEELKRKRRMTQEEIDRSIEQMKRNGEIRMERKFMVSKREEEMERRDQENAAHTLSRDEKPEFIERVQSSVYGKTATLEDRVQRSAPKFQMN